MKNKLYKFLSQSYIVVGVMIIALILSIADRNFVFYSPNNNVDFCGFWRRFFETTVLLDRVEEYFNLI